MPAMLCRHSRSMRSKAVVRWVLVVLTAAAYSETLRYGFVSFDDFDYVAMNRMVKAGLTLQGVAWAFTTDPVGASGAHASHTWHPITWLSLMLDVEVYRWLGRLMPALSRVLATTNTGLCPGGHHLTNLLFHIANALLLFELLRSMTGAIWRSAMAAALLALHPLHVESVAWISERKDVLSMFFGLLTLHAYVRYTRDPRWSGYVLHSGVVRTRVDGQVDAGHAALRALVARLLATSKGSRAPRRPILDRRSARCACRDPLRIPIISSGRFEAGAREAAAVGIVDRGVCRRDPISEHQDPIG
jgi:hypothetical protein